MAVREVFGLIVRVAGFAFVIAGLLDWMHVAMSQLGLPISSRYPAAVIATSGAFYLLLGVVLLFAAEPITRAVYGRNRISN